MTGVQTCALPISILLMEDEHSELKIVASKEEHKQITTNADELLKNKTENSFSSTKSKKVNIKVDENQRVHKIKDLKKDDKNYLLKKSFKKHSFKSLLSNKKEDYLIKPRHNESPTHLLVIEDIKNYLEKKGIEVKTFITKKPDLVFELNGKKFAIEVETGAVLTKVSRMKEKLEVLKDYDKWFFVVTNKNKVAKYRKFGPTIDLRFIRRQLNKILKFKKSHSA